MVKAIEFVVRDYAGGLVRGSVAGEGSNFVQLGMSEEISLNLARESIAGFVQQGDDLVISLIDGRQVVLAGYFNEDGEPNQLYLSQNGEVIAVELSEAGDGNLFASYGPTDGWDKFSTLDDLRFGQGDDLALAAGATDEPAGMAGFLPGLVGMGGAGAGLAGVGIIGGLIGGGGGSGVTGPIAPTVNEPDRSQTVTTESSDKTLDVSGTGQPGDTVVVTIGDETQETTIGPNGTWAVVFPQTGLPADGTHDTTVVFTHTGGSTTTLDGPTFIIDMTPPAVEVTDGAKSTGDVENAGEYANGVTIAGEGEVGAAIAVQVGSFTQTTTVGSNGTWSVTFPTTQIQTGEYEIPFTVTATDALGNDTVLNDILVVDTVPHPIAFNPVTADNIVNGAESAAGFQITGTSTAGATLTVTVGTLTQTVTVGANGTWSTSFAPGALTPGEYDATVTANTVDAAGNASSSTHTFRVDTATNVAFSAGAVEGDNTVNAVEARDGVVLTGTAQPGATVQVAWNNTTLPATVAADGSWTVTFPASAVTAGTYSSSATVTATDAAGNTATATRTINVDTEVVPHRIAGIGTGADDVLNAAEAATGLTITGFAEAGSTVMVKLGSGSAVPATVAADGSWTVTIPAGQVPAGETTVAMAVIATDAAGNISTITDNVKVDTLVRNFARTGGQIAGDGIVNAAEAAAGVSFSGTVEPGSTVVVRLQNGSEQTVTAGANGIWSVSFSAAQLPSGSGTSQATFTATDPAGNTKTLTESFRYDTDAPDALTTLKIVRDGQEVTGIFTGTNGEDVTIHQIDGNGLTKEISHEVNANVTVSVNGVRIPADNYDFDTGVRDGTYLVIGNTDAAGNEASTLLIVNNTNTVNVDLGRDGLADFDFSKIDLTFAPQANLTLTAADLDALTGADKQLTIMGGADDNVALDNAVANGQTINGYAVYTLGSGTVLVDEDINTTVI